MKKNNRISIVIASDMKEELKTKASAMGLSLSSFILLVLTQSLKGELRIKNI